MCVCGLCVCAHVRVRAQTVVCKIWKLGIFQDCHSSVVALLFLVPQMLKGLIKLGVMQCKGVGRK